MREIKEARSAARERGLRGGVKKSKTRSMSRKGRNK